MMGSLLGYPTSLILKFLSIEEEGPVTIKKIFIVLLLKLWHFIFKPRFHFHDFNSKNDFVKAGAFPHELEWKLERPQDSSHLERGEDEILFYGVNSKKECLLVRVARNNDHTAEAWLYLRLSNGKLFVMQETGNITDDNCFNAAGLRLQCLSPLRIWRIFFNGLLKENDENIIHVKFSFIWSALSDVYDFTSDINLSAMSDALIHAPLNSIIQNIQRTQQVMNIYVQHGQIRGTVILEQSDEEKEMYLWGTRMRNLRKVSSEQDFCHIFAYLQDGKLLHIGIESIDNVVKRLHHGQIMNSNGNIYVIKCKILSNDESNQIIDKKIEFSLKENNYKLKFISEIYSTFFMRSKWPNGIELKHVLLTHCGKKGHGIILKGKIMKSTSKNYLIQKTMNKTENLLVVPLTSYQCQAVELTGGKGASLGILSEIAAANKSFIVPSGIVVTTKAYKLFQDTKVMNEIILSLEKAAWKTKQCLKEECQRVIKEIMKIPIPNIVCDEIERHLKEHYSINLNKIKFSIRSSACGEDSDDMSAAGQMDTYLGIYGLKEILTAVKKCWASQFLYVAIEYKRQNGQLLNSPMAVVIQEMVNADVAGVMFTCNPVTSNPKYITITANYGLGESVVAAKAEPDTISLKRDINQKLTLNNIDIGTKSKKIVMNENGNIIEEENVESKTKCCLTNEQAFYLGNVGIELEKKFGSCRDIEWCFVNDKLYLLQSRPITSITTESDFEIAHEFDSMFRAEDEYLSTGNIGEVLPGALSPLCLSLITKLFGLNFSTDKWIEMSGNKLPRCPYFSKSLHYFNNHALFNVIDAWLSNLSDENSTAHKAIMISAIGRVINDDKLYEKAKERFALYKTSLTKKIYNILFLSKILLFAENNLNWRRRKYFNYKIKDLENFKTSLQLYEDIPNHWKYIIMGIDSNSEGLITSTIYNSSLMSILVKEHEGWNNDVYADFAYLLSNCSNVESADVPKSLETLAETISNDLHPSTFKSMKTEDALKWLQTSLLKSAEEYKSFLDNHGHRCIKEFDPYSSPWRKNQYYLVKTLQDIVNNAKKSKASNNSDIFSKLIKYPSWKSRLIYKFLLPRCQNTIREREKAKSFMIKMFDMIRDAYWHLADMMVLEGRLPEKDLLFFLSHDEIGELLKTRSPRLIAKAVRRKKIYPEQDKIIYPEIANGIPYPINLNTSNSVYNSQNLMKGISVSCGIAKGPARIILNLDEAINIQQGDILITYSTDIGWSPYFPMLGGVVTEIGGLISHGAVVAREYGLPCIVAVHGAIKNFKTGDLVILNGNKGTLQKVETNSINGDK